MPRNPYFSFKRFSISQATTTQKVSTEACLFGGYVASQAMEFPLLDIGTGTGLLALMLAQVNPDGQIDAIEIEPSAATEAAENVTKSGFRVNVLCADFQTFSPDYQYETIVCNPPFFQGSLLSPKNSRNLAAHAVGLTLEALADAVGRLLSPTGAMFVLLPPPEASVFDGFMQKKNLFLTDELAFQDNGNRPILRVIRQYQYEKVNFQPKNLTIRQENNAYTPEFVALLKDYYLYL